MIRKLSLLAVVAALMVGAAFTGAGLRGLDGDAAAQTRERPSNSMMGGGAMDGRQMMDGKQMMKAMSADPEMRRHMRSMETSMDDMTKLMRDHMGATKRP